MNLKVLNRSLLFRLNKFQRRILYPIVICTTIACTVALVSIFSIYCLESYSDNIFHLNRTLFKIYISRLIAGLSVLLFLILLWAFYIANKTIGPYQRILNELDSVLQCKRKTPITLRKGDEMFEEVFKRINKIIKMLY